MPQPAGAPVPLLECVLLVEMLSALGLVSWRFVLLMVSLLDEEFLIKVFPVNIIRQSLKEGAMKLPANSFQPLLAAPLILSM